MSQDIQIILGLLAGMIITSGWWFVAVRLRQHWTIYALAIVSTSGLLLSAVISFRMLSHHPNGQPINIATLSHVASALSVMHALLFIPFVVWLVNLVPSSGTALQSATVDR